MVLDYAADAQCGKYHQAASCQSQQSVYHYKVQNHLSYQTHHYQEANNYTRGSQQ
jgi:hypothetical protein